MAHALLSPSSAKRWMNCPGSVTASRGVESPETVHSRRGTFGHDIAAKCLLAGCKAQAFFGTKSADGEFTFDEELVSAVQLYLDVVESLVLVTGGELQIEQKVYLSPNVHGTADALIWEPGREKLHVIDLKLGAGTFVDVEDNEQALTYGVAALATAGIPAHLVKEVELHIVQPLYKGAEPHRRWVAQPTVLRLFQQRLAAAELAALRPGAALVAGDHCKWCPVKGTCSALQARALEAAQDVFPDLTDPTTVQAPPLLEAVPTDRLAKIVQAANTVESWIAAVRKEAFRRATAGETLPGLKLVARIANRQWKSEADAIALLKKCGADPFDSSVVSPAEAERRAPQAKKLISALVERPVTGVSLVPESDKRPAIDRSAAAMFPELEDS